MLRRRSIRSDLNGWCIEQGFQPAAHHRVINKALTELATGVHEKVMLFMPPGAAKSTYASVLFPPWFMANNPKLSVLAASHSEDLAERWGRRVRNLVEENTNLLAIDTNAGNRAADRWQLAARYGERSLDMGEYLAAGAGSAIAGYRGDLGIMDDLIKGREQAMSESQRQKLWEWYIFDFKPRLKPGARQLAIGTRWHEDDPFGRMLEQEGEDTEGGEWHVVRIPMIAESLDDPLGRAIGERLWPEWFTDKMVADAQRDPALWLSLYQQRPTIEDGTYWKREWLHPVNPKHVPPRNTMRCYGGSDYAVSADRGDYTVHVVIGLDPSDRPWLLDLWREQTPSNVWVDTWCDMVRFYKPMQWAEERGQIISGVGPFLEREQLKQKAYTQRIQFTSRLDKGVRAQSMRSHIATHGLWYANDLPDRAALESELLSFPAGKHDDIHDAIGLVGQLLDMAVHGKKPKPPAASKDGGYKKIVSATDTGSLDAWKLRA